MTASTSTVPLRAALYLRVSTARQPPSQPQPQPLPELTRWTGIPGHGVSQNPMAARTPPSAMSKPAEILVPSGMADKSGGISDDIDL